MAKQNIYPTIIRTMQDKQVKIKMNEIPRIQVEAELQKKTLGVRDLPGWIDAHVMRQTLTGDKDII